jgi:NitT/TauT family transport system permease protein
MENKIISEDRKKYLRKVKMSKIAIIFTQIFILISFITIWEILTETKIINSFITSSPSRILNTFMNMKENDLMMHIGVTVYETIIGFVIGTILGLIIAILLWWSEFLSKVLEPFLVVLSSLPKTALGPIIIIWVGAGTPAIIVMGIAISLVVTILDISNGFLNTEEEKIKMAQSFNASKLQILTKIVIPSNISTFINTLKVNIGLSLVGVITGEFLVSKAGLGYLIVYGGQVFQLDLVMASVIILAIVAAVMYEAVVLLEKLILKSKKFG